MHTYQNLPYLTYLKRSSSEYVYNIYNLVGQFSSAVVLSGLRTISDIIVAFMVFAFLAWSNIYAFILLASILSISLLLYDKSFRQRLAKSGQTTNTASTKLSQSIHEGIDGLKEIRLLGVEDFFRQKVDIAASQIRDNQIIYRLILTSPRYMLELILVGFIVLLIVGNSFFEGDRLGLTSTLVVYGVASIRLMPIFNSFSSTINQLRFNRDTVSKLYSDLSNSTTDQDHLNQSIIPLNNNVRQEEFSSLKINKVSFSYPKTNKKILNNISIEIKKNEIIGIVGASGSGKSTLVNAILGLLPVTKGSIEYNNTNIQECMPYFQSQIAYLPQDVYIINDSIKNNVALGLHETEIDNKRLNSAIRKAQLADFVNNSPMGVETVLGANGVKISGGQRQRIALARTFYHQRNIIFMDESTSALDNETEHEISEEIKKLKGDKTVIIISHRLSILKYCDQIYQMDHRGKVIATDYNTIALQGEQKK
jgi:ABC-type multidrug transport system fused ATPase/permease subunit